MHIASWSRNIHLSECLLFTFCLPVVPSYISDWFAERLICSFDVLQALITLDIKHWKMPVCKVMLAFVALFVLLELGQCQKLPSKFFLYFFDDYSVFSKA